jgi:hypothetical protein
VAAFACWQHFSKQRDDFQLAELNSVDGLVPCHHAVGGKGGLSELFFH